VQDVLEVCGALSAGNHKEAKVLLDRIVAMLTKPGRRGCNLGEEPGEYRSDRIDTDSDTDPDPEVKNDDRQQDALPDGWRRR